MRPDVAALVCCLAWAAPWTSHAVAQERPALVAAAADLKFAMGQIADEFARETGRQVRITFGSSGDLARQIAQGAPFELLLSADERHVFGLQRAGLTRGDGVLYAIGRLALFVPRDSPIQLDADLRGLTSAVLGGQVTRFAIANPDHAPYGRAAREVLERLGLWQPVQSSLVLGENASQAMQFAASGSCQGGIVPLSLASAPDVAALGSFVRIPAEWHSPLRQRMVLVTRAGPVASAFYDYLQQAPGARRAFDRFGFARPDGK
jgi:molybdate transport system substrate-binding protein